MDIVLRTNGLTKSFNRLKAVDHISITVRKGEVYGFLGRNGAGKTTTLRMIAGLMRPTAGTMELFGKNISPSDTDHLDRIGSLIEFPGFYPNLSVAENLDMHRYLMGMSDPRTIDECLALVELQEVKHRKVGKLSLGMKQRLGIARAMLHKPELLILDEPMNGLDPVGIRAVRRLIRSLVENRRIAVLISSHLLSEVQQIADRIGIIHHGRLLKEFELDDMAKGNRRYVQVKVDQERKAAYVLEQHCGVRNYSIIERGMIRIYEQWEHSAQFNRTLVQQGVEVSELIVQQESLEDYFVKLTGDNND